MKVTRSEKYLTALLISLSLRSIIIIFVGIFEEAIDSLFQ